MVLALLAPAASAQERPNVVVFLTDDQTLSQMGALPTVERLIGRRGTTFTRQFSTFPLCCPARATLMTGQYAHNHRVLHNAGPYGGYKRLNHANTLPVWLQRAGYRTLQVGRWLNNYGIDNADLTEIPPGWNEWFVPVGSSAQAYQGQTINENGLLRFFTQYQADLYAQKAVDLIQASPSPFFLNMTFSAPHLGRPRDSDDPTLLGTPSPAPRHRDAFAGLDLPRPPSFDEPNVRDKPQDVFERPRLSPELIAAIRENWQQELESLLAVDEAIGRILGVLRDSGRLDNTLIVFTSDHGYMHGEHRIPTEKVWPYDESTHVPLLLRGPGVPAGLRLGQLTGNIDVVPTILDAAGASASLPLDGRSLFELMRDPKLEWGRDVLLESGFGANRVGAYAAIRNYRYLYVEWGHSGEFELYDLKRDPWALRNLEGKVAYESVQKELGQRLGRLKRCVGSGCRRSPRLRLRALRPGKGACARRAVVFRLGGAEARKVARVDFFSAGRRRGRDRVEPFELELPPSRRARRARARATLRYGGALTLDRRLAGCS